MNFYTNVVRLGNNILIREIKDGVRHDRKEKYKPTFYVPSGSEGPDFKNIEGHPLTSYKPGFMSECRDFLQQYKDVDDFIVHGTNHYQSQWISDNYGADAVEFDTSLIRVCNMDIEVAPPPGGGFPKADEAKGEINAITIYDSISKHYFIWSLGEWSAAKTELDFITADNSTFVYCPDEMDLIIRFATHMGITRYDVITGWYIESFDIPYLVNRIRAVAGEKVAIKLSPWGKINARTHRNNFGQETTSYELLGTTVLDYLELYKTFTYSAQESFSLDYIANLEVGARKLDYSEVSSLHNLYLTNNQKYVDYNIRDVELVRLIDEKMQLLDLIFSIAYYARVNYNHVFSPVRTWDTIIYNTLRQQGIAIPPSVHKSKSRSFAGAYVKEPKIGFSDWIVSMDLASLYPHLIMQYNLGPDTIVDGLQYDVDVDGLVDQKYHYTPELRKRNVSLAANGTCYTNTKRGFLPQLMESLYIDRKKNKKTMLEWEQIQADIKYEMDERGMV